MTQKAVRQISYENDKDGPQATYWRETACTLSLHVQDDKIVKVTSPLDQSVTHGHLCIKGRFGFEFVQIRRK